MAEIPSDSITGNVLVVDDDITVLTTISELLTAIGLEVQVAKNGREDLDTVEKDPPDLILLDINLPDMDGYEVCRRIRTGEASSDIPVIFLSVLTESDDIIKAFASGGSDYIPKPYNVKELLSRVQAHLAKGLMQRTLRAFP